MREEHKDWAGKAERLSAGKEHHLLAGKIQLLSTGKIKQLNLLLDLLIHMGLSAFSDVENSLMEVLSPQSVAAD
jgi:hypothetical protein